MRQSEGRTIEENLAIFETLPCHKVSYHRVLKSALQGLFHSNDAPVRMPISIKSSKSHKRIKEPIIRAIRNDPSITDELRDLIDMGAYAGERIQAISTFPLESIHMVENKPWAIIDLPAGLTKNDRNHPCIIPKELAERILQRALEMGHSSPFPQYHSLWKKITEIAERKYDTHLTSHYFRRRFETIAEKINAEDMNPNHWTILMGDKPEHGHMPDIYSMTDEDDPILDEFATHLAPRLSLTDEAPTAQPSKLARFIKENRELKEQIIQLTKLLTEKLSKSQLRAYLKIGQSHFRFCLSGLFVATHK